MERELQQELEEQEETNLQIEESMPLQADAVAKGRKVKKLWGLLQASKGDAKDLQVEHQREREDLLETIPSHLRRNSSSSSYADYDEAAEKWSIAQIAHTYNNIWGTLLSLDNPSVCIAITRSRKKTIKSNSKAPNMNREEAEEDFFASALCFRTCSSVRRAGVPAAKNIPADVAVAKEARRATASGKWGVSGSRPASARKGSTGSAATGASP
ncbi:hypothetical protein BJ742DRAFT_770519 [Cladochytrium replicatum]|nr:hypothetical protein BJ742DRAFT_770519 [Cladochytrium replicatum]